MSLQKIQISRVQKLIPLNQPGAGHFETHFRVRAAIGAEYYGAVVTQEELDANTDNLPFQAAEGGELLGSVSEDTGQTTLWYLVLQAPNDIEAEIQLSEAPLGNAPTAAAAVVSAPQNGMSPKTKKILKWLIIVLILAGAAVAIYFLVIKRAKGGTDVSESSITESFVAETPCPDSCDTDADDVLDKINQLQPLG